MVTQVFVEPGHRASDSNNMIMLIIITIIKVKKNTKKDCKKAHNTHTQMMFGSKIVGFIVV